MPEDALKTAYDSAASCAASCAALERGGQKFRPWAKVTGPTMALWPSMRELGWDWIGAHRFTDDMGNSWDAKADPPCVLAKAAKASTARKRNKDLGKQMPGLLPADCDVADVQLVGEHTLIDLSHITARLASGRVQRVKEVPEWKAEFAGHLRSASTGAQWTQVRRCMVPAFGLTDKRCQLCLSEDGTAAHRWRCSATTPADGWTPMTSRAARVEEKIGTKRAQLLAEHGLLTLAVPKRAWRKYDTFKWLSTPPDTTRNDLVWYVDGSGYNNRWSALATYGFGIVVVSKAGDLVAWGNGVPPKWTASVADAETWAVAKVLSLNPAPPAVVTDCMSVLHVARAGKARAGSAAMPLARVWSYVLRPLDGDPSALTGDRLTWMPAHKSAKGFRKYKRSDGKTVSSVDWRANRLVDVLAKEPAETNAAPRATTAFIRWAV